MSSASQVPLVGTPGQAYHANGRRYVADTVTGFISNALDVDISVLIGLGVSAGVKSSVVVSDGTNTETGTTTINFTSGATVSSGGAGVADVAISGGGGILQATVTLNAAQCITLGASPVTVVAAPGVGKVIIPLYYAFRLTQGSNLFDGLGPEKVFYAGHSLLYDATPSFAVGDAASFVTSGQATVYTGGSVDFSNLALLFGGADLNYGPIVTSHLGDGGTGYAPGDTGTVTGDSGDAFYTVDTVGVGGVVLTYHLTNNGTGYGPGNTETTSPLTGSGDGNFTIVVDTVTEGNGTMGLTVGYQIVTVP